jgi:hypothetical protein
VRGSCVELVPNPWTDPGWPISKLQALATELAESDYWVRQRLHVRPRFPHALELLRAVKFAASQFYCRRQGRDCSGNLWERPEGHLILRHILTEFVTTANAVGSQPVLLLVPPVSRWAEGRVTPRYAAFFDSTLSGPLADLLVIDLADAEFDETRFNIAPFTNHASPYGNQIIAREVAVAIRPLLVEPASDSR